MLAPATLRMLNSAHAQLVDAIRDSLSRLAQLVHGPVGGVALRNVGRTGVVHQQLCQRAEFKRGLFLSASDDRWQIE